jgi:hypothetical protein
MRTWSACTAGPKIVAVQLVAANPSSNVSTSSSIYRSLSIAFERYGRLTVPARTKFQRSLHKYHTPMPHPPESLVVARTHHPPSVRCDYPDRQHKGWSPSADARGERVQHVRRVPLIGRRRLCWSTTLRRFRRGTWLCRDFLAKLPAEADLLGHVAAHC